MYDFYPYPSSCFECFYFSAIELKVPISDSRNNLEVDRFEMVNCNEVLCPTACMYLYFEQWVFRVLVWKDIYFDCKYILKEISIMSQLFINMPKLVYERISTFLKTYENHYRVQRKPQRNITVITQMLKFRTLHIWYVLKEIHSNIYLPFIQKVLYQNSEDH